METKSPQPFGIERFYKKVFTITLGSILMVIPFYAGARKMLLLTDKEVEWGGIHYTFFGIGLILFVGGFILNKLADIFLSVASGIAAKFINKAPSDTSGGTDSNP